MSSFEPVDVAATLRSLTLEITNLKRRKAEQDLRDTAREVEWHSHDTARNTEISELKKQVKALHKKINKINTERGTERQQYQRKVHELQREIHELREEVEDYKEENDALKDELKNHKERIRELEGKTSDLEMKNSELENQMTKNRNTLMKIERRTVVNDARQKLSKDYGLTISQLLPANHWTRWSSPDQELESAVTFVFDKLSQQDKIKLPRDALRRIMLNTSEYSFWNLGNKAAHRSTTEEAI